MQLLLLFIIVFTSAFSLATTSRTKVYLDVEDGRKESVFNMSGILSWDVCNNTPGCQGVIWPDNKSEIEILRPIKKMKVKSKYTGKLEDEEFAYVQVTYQREVDGKIKKITREGWISAARLSSTKVKPFFTQKPPAAKKEVCDPKNSSAPNVSKDLRPVATAFENKGVSQIADALKPYVGKCVLRNVRNPSANVPNTYDEYVLPTLLKSPIPQVENESGKNISRQELIDIDALARTLYGEMAGCFKHGLHYPMAVARIVYNRFQTPERSSEFIKGAHSKEKSRFGKIITSASQFNVWMPTHGPKENGSLKMALCPPSGKGNSWQGFPPGDSEREIWDDALRIAIETVLFPNDKFTKRTNNVQDLHYTSGLDKFYNFKKVFPSIEGRSISRNSCVQVWRDPKNT